MNVNTEQMAEYAEFLAEKSTQIINLCNQIENLMTVAIQCMDQQSGRGAALRLTQNMENVKANVPISDDAAKRLIKSRKLVEDAGRVFGG